jgi:hypothetical protein
MAEHAQLRWWQRREVQLAGIAVAVVALIVGVIAFTDDDDEPELVEAVESPEPEPTASEVREDTPPPTEVEDPLTRTVGDVLDERPLSGTLTDLEDRLPPVSTGELGPGWIEIAVAPIESRTNAVAVWTGSEVLIWGGRADNVLADGAAYDPSSDTWRVLPTSPLSARSNTAAVWAGTELLVIGGLNDDGQPLYDSASFDPVSNQWQTLDAEFGGPDYSIAVGWTGRFAVVAGADGPETDLLVSNAFLYDPDTGDFEPIDAIPLGGPDVERVGFAADGGIYMLEADAQSDLVTIDFFNVSTGGWEEGSPIPGLRALDLDPRAAAWTASEFVLAPATADGAIYDPETGETTPIPGSRSSVRWPAVMVDGHVFYGDVRFDPETDSWLTDVAYPFPDPEFPMVVAIDDAAFVWGGSGCGRTVSCSAFVGVEQGLIWNEPFADADRLLPTLPCPRGVIFEQVDDIDQPSEGFASAEDAGDFWWTEGTGTDRVDRDELRRQLSRSFVTYEDGDGNAQVVIRVERVNEGWYIVATSECRR